jgi:hypothetical protein
MLGASLIWVVTTLVLPAVEGPYLSEGGST